MKKNLVKVGLTLIVIGIILAAYFLINLRNNETTKVEIKIYDTSEAVIIDDVIEVNEKENLDEALKRCYILEYDNGMLVKIGTSSKYLEARNYMSEGYISIYINE